MHAMRALYSLAGRATCMKDYFKVYDLEVTFIPSYDFYMKFDKKAQIQKLILTRELLDHENNCM